MLNPIPHLTAQLDLPPARFLDRSIAVLHRAAAETKARGQGQCVESEACEIVGFCQLFLISETVFPIRGRPGKASHHPRLLRDSDPQQIPPDLCFQTDSIVLLQRARILTMRPAPNVKLDHFISSSDVGTSCGRCSVIEEPLPNARLSTLLRTTICAFAEPSVLSGCN